MTTLNAWPLRALVCLQLLALAIHPVSADTVFWEGHVSDQWHVGDNWSLNLRCGPVICFQVPPQPDDTATVSDSTFGSSVFMNADEQVLRLRILNGMVVRTNGFHMDAGGGLVSPLASLEIHGNGSQLRVNDAGSPANDLFTSRMHLLSGGSLRLAGSPQVEISDLYSFTETSSSILGNGTIRFTNTRGLIDSVLRNNGGIVVRSGDLTLMAENGGYFDLDGATTTGRLDVDDLDNVTSRNLTLTVEGPQLEDTFDGTIRIGKGDRVHFAHPWNLGRPQGPGTLVEMNARDTTATLSGADVTMNDGQGRIEVRSGTARFEADLDVVAGALVVSDNTTVDFAGDAIFRAAALIDKTAAGDHEMIVRGRTEIYQPVFDWDGAFPERHVTSVIGGSLNIFSDRIEPLSGSNFFDGTINILSEPADSAVVRVATQGPWYMDGTMHLDGTHNIARVITDNNVSMYVGNSQGGDAFLQV